MDNLLLKTPLPPSTVLVVEDNIDDVALIELACQRCGVPHNFKFVTDGEMAIDYLNGSKEYADRQLHPFPSLIFLDVNLPKLRGHEILQWIRSQPKLKSLPVVMLTGSSEKCDVERAYQLGATSYLQKSAAIEEFKEAVSMALKYWLEINIPAGSKHPFSLSGSPKTYFVGFGDGTIPPRNQAPSDEN